MKITRLKIKNFKTIKEIDISLDSKVNVITGDTGSGKSSILEAVSYLLTDSLDDKLIEYVRWGQ